jgi:hypothetical protein
LRSGGRRDRQGRNPQVDTAKGTTTKADKVVLIIETKAGRKEVPLKADICADDNECTDLLKGEIYRYETSVLGKRLPVDTADKAERISIDAPGAKISAPRDAKVFKKFSAMCLIREPFPFSVAIGRFVAERCEAATNFDTEDALRRLLADVLVRSDAAGKLTAIAPEEARDHLDLLWDRLLGGNTLDQTTSQRTT